MIFCWHATSVAMSPLSVVKEKADEPGICAASKGLGLRSVFETVAPCARLSHSSAMSGGTAAACAGCANPRKPTATSAKMKSALRAVDLCRWPTPRRRRKACAIMQFSWVRAREAAVECSECEVMLLAEQRERHFPMWTGDRRQD